MKSDVLSSVCEGLWRVVRNHYRQCLVVAAILTVLMAAAIPRIQTDTSFLGLFKESTREARAYHYVETHLVPMNSVEIVVRGQEGAFKKPDSWKKVRECKKSLERLPEVRGIDTLTDVLENLFSQISTPGTDPSSLFENKKAISQLLFLMSSTERGRAMVRSYLSPDLSCMRIQVRMGRLTPEGLVDVVNRAREVATGSLKELGSVFLTGQLALGLANSQALIRSQVWSLALALICITVLLMIQFRSVSMGLLSLIPNVFPLVIIFGTMAWFGITMNGITVLVCAICFGFSVDDSIHFLTHFRQHLASQRRDAPIEPILYSAYRKCARALITTSSVFFFGLLVLAWSPLQPSASFGVLMAVGSVAALMGDVVIMPSVILASPVIQRVLKRTNR